jgi:hypothetical protein
MNFSVSQELKNIKKNEKSKIHKKDPSLELKKEIKK